MPTSNISLDIDSLISQANQIQLQNNIATGNNANTPETFNTRTSVFVTGKDPQSTVKKATSIPQITEVDILKDSLDNPFVSINFQCQKADIDSGKYVYFNVYKVNLPSNQIQVQALQPVIQYDQVAYDKLSRKTKKTGKFSNTKKANSSVNQTLVPQSVTNPNIAYQVNNSIASPNSSPTMITTGQGSSNGLINNNNPNAIIVCTINTANSKVENFATVGDTQFATFFYEDTNIQYGSAYQYYISAVGADSEESSFSQAISVFIEDLESISAPQSITQTQINEHTIALSIVANSSDNVYRSIIYKRSEDEVSFNQIAIINNVTDKMQFQDSNLEYNKQYTYRVFFQNIHGTISDPSELTLFSTYQGAIAKSKSNNFKIPIFTANQDQNSNYVKIVISVNDTQIAFYKLERRDLTIHETKYVVPEQYTTNFGSTTPPWTGGGILFVDYSNTSFVSINKTQNSFSSSFTVGGSTIAGTGSSDQGFSLSNVNKSDPTAVSTFDNPNDQTLFTLIKQNQAPPIEFIDQTVQSGHIYSYRITGYDLFGNTSSCAFQTVLVTGKNSIRTPINFNAQVLRTFPFRMKLSWQDDNAQNVPTPNLLTGSIILDAGSLATSISQKVSASQQPVFYKVERRQLGQINYEVFPLTLNSFLVDEAQSIDNIPFSTNLIPDTFSASANLPANVLTLKTQNSSSIRPFGTPEFLMENNTYFYRVSAISDDGTQSNPTDEFPVVTIGDLSDPINFSVTSQNKKIRPVVVQCSWSVQTDKFLPDYWIIERKTDQQSDSFVTVGIAYIETQFFDRNVTPGFNYIYRIRSVDVFGRQSNTFQQSIKL